MNRTIQPRLASVAACVTLGLASAAHASLIAYEGFSAGVGSLSSQPSTEGGAGSDPLVGNWTSAYNTTVATSSLATVISTSSTVNPWVSSIASQPLDGYAALFNATATATVAFRAFTSALPSTGNVYLGFLLQRIQNASSNVTAFVGFYNAAGTEEIEAGNEGNGASAFGVYSTLTPTSHTGGAVSGTELQATSSTGTYTTQLVVADLDYTDDEIKFWLNPTSTSATPIETGFYSVPLPTNLTYLRIAASAGNAADFGEITIGTTFADVVSGAPEPSALALLSLPAITLLRRRRSAAP